MQTGQFDVPVVEIRHSRQEDGGATGEEDWLEAASSHIISAMESNDFRGAFNMAHTSTCCKLRVTKELASLSPPLPELVGACRRRGQSR